MRRSRHVPLRWAIALSLAVSLGCGADDRVRLYAAASLSETAHAIADECARDPGIDVLATIEGTSMLARQLIAGAPPGVFLSADEAWADALEGEGLVASREPLLGNSLVCVTARAPRGASWEDALASAGRIAVADTDSVPAGRYARAAMTSVGIWERDAPRVVRTPDVRAALALVLHDDVDAAVVYATDAAAAGAEHVLPIPEHLHPPVIYTLVVVRDAPPDAERLAEFLRGARARALFEAAGFTVLRDR